MGAWVDYIVLDSCNRPMEVCTSQVDFQSAKYWNISFTDKDNKKKMPYILHTGFGIERTTAALLEILSRKKNPTFPLWLSPTQVRLCPVNDSFINYCEKIADELEKENVRVDIDDRAESVQKKIRDSETEWIPMAIVVGEKEKKSGKLPVRFRETGKVEEMKMEKLVKKVKKETKDYPFEPLPLPRLLSKRPKFVG
jgi:threonyl-tRNA synthetase